MNIYARQKHTDIENKFAVTEWERECGRHKLEVQY